MPRQVKRPRRPASIVQLSWASTPLVSTKAYAYRIRPGAVVLEGTEPCGKPEFTSDGKTITLKSSTPGAWFRYTLDGTEPTRTRGYVYCGAISEQPGIQVKAIAYKSGMKDSAVAGR